MPENTNQQSAREHTRVGVARDGRRRAGGGVARLEVEQELRVGAEKSPRAVVDEQVAAEERGRVWGVGGGRGEVGAEARHRVLSASSTFLRNANARKRQFRVCRNYSTLGDVIR